MGISARTRHPEEAAKFLDFFFNTEEAARLLGTVRSIPPTQFAQQIVTQQGLVSSITAGTVATSLSYAGFDDGGLSTSAEVTSILIQAYEGVSHGTMTPAVAARNVVTQINAFLARQ